MNKNQLSVRLNGKPVGILEQTPNGNMAFSYDASATQMISVAMPLREEPYGDIQTEAYFGGLLPESETVKKIIGKRYGISPNNNFSLLKAIGYDCAGAISCNEINKPIVTQGPHLLTGRIITDDELYQHIVELPQKPLFMDDIEGLRLSLAGVQDKAAVCLIDNQIALAENGCPTTHILKPPSHHFEGLVENEYFCLRMAKRIGLPVPDIQLRQVKDITYLLIERYDRRIKDKHVERVHQEDFCQALGTLTSKKYQNEGGPGFKECFELLKSTTQPAIDRNYLASALVFNYLIGNMDAHGKNFSLLHYTQSNIRLAPFYDMICTRVYPTLTSKMAMKIGSQYDADNLFARHWEQLCKDINYRYIAMKDIIKNHAEFILKIADEEKEILISTGQYRPIIDNIINVTKNNIKRTLDRFDNG
ncbi:MAG: type II toxin-antitoxin system HipA family toxin [Gammaproteobacteria bacterium]|nr:type II toxin-antitoxin system HipA family toxin [Gammaproteobacteria bacterium]